MKAILTDITKCIGCNECVKSCKIINKLPPDKPREWQKNDGLSAKNWTSVLHNEKYYLRKQCRHCIEPACASVCPVGALQKTETGAVIYDSGKCLGCRYCMMACPFGIPRYDWDNPVPYIKKCILCYNNIKDGKINQPACTSACPTGATIYGDREELLREARNRVLNEPNKYLNHIYGEHEVGGTNVIYITAKDCPLDFLYYYNNRVDKNIKLFGQPDINEPLPITTKWAMGAVPFAFLGMGAIMSGTFWIIRRRQQIHKEQEDINSKEEIDEQNK
jgi:formate dehydrogenase iron-sulfur subunit